MDWIKVPSNSTEAVIESGKKNSWLSQAFGVGEGEVEKPHRCDWILSAGMTSFILIQCGCGVSLGKTNPWRWVFLV